MGTIFALQGAGSSGKSSTLIELLRLIESTYPKAARQYHRPHRKVDVAVILSPVKGLKIGIESQGDPNSKRDQSPQVQSFQVFLAANCDIIFCACRTSGMTVQWVNNMSPSYTVQFVPQTPTQTGQQAANAKTAARLMRLAGI